MNAATVVVNDTPSFLQEEMIKKAVGRKDLSHIKRILIKVGTNVVTDAQGTPALSRIGNIVEQIVQLQQQGKEVILVSSGSVGLGRPKLQRKQTKNNNNNASNNNNTSSTSDHEILDVRSCAAVGQAKLMHLYEFLFRQKSSMCSQILVTDEDFRNPVRKQNLKSTIDRLVRLGVVPILNENDVVAHSQGSAGVNGGGFLYLWDNDSLACLTGMTIAVGLIILLSDVDGVYKRLPNEGEIPEIIPTYSDGLGITIGVKSSNGRGGMQAKIDAIMHTLKHDVVDDVTHQVDAIVIANGFKSDTVLKVVSGEQVGTLFVRNPTSSGDGNGNGDSNGNSGETTAKKMAEETRNASRALQKLSLAERKTILHAVAEKLLQAEKQILQENVLDVEEAKKSNTSSQLVARLQLSSSKLKTLADGLKSIANSKEDPIGKLLRRTELATGLILEQVTVPIGVLLVIFESRPDVLPQVSALALMSGNGLLLKGGKEAVRTNRLLHRLIIDSVYQSSKGKVPREIIHLIETRDTIKDLLQQKDHIDLVIPRGSNQLVSYIQQNTKIPVLGHAEGICHLYIHHDADMDKAERIIIDSKTDYPSACNAVETLLIHSDLVKDGRLARLLESLAKANVQIFCGPKAQPILLLQAAKSMREEYGDLAITIEIVDNLDEAISHINRYSSSHTDSIVTENPLIAQRFLNEVDSACVFLNASTRFADGFRFGLGAEVGISTGRIHARGPVGIDGLLTTKWKLVSKSGHVVADFTKGKQVYTHTSLPLAKL